jgi:hypothetical protein
MTEDMANPDSTAPVAHIDGLGWPAKAELDASVLQRWRICFMLTVMRAHGAALTGSRS